MVQWIVAALAGLAALVLGFLGLKWKRESNAKSDVIKTLASACSKSAKAKAETEAAQGVAAAETAAAAVKEVEALRPSAPALASAKARVESVVAGDGAEEGGGGGGALPPDLLKFVRESASRMSGELK